MILSQVIGLIVIPEPNLLCDKINITPPLNVHILLLFGRNARNGEIVIIIVRTTRDSVK